MPDVAGAAITVFLTAIATISLASTLIIWRSKSMEKKKIKNIGVHTELTWLPLKKYDSIRL